MATMKQINCTRRRRGLWTCVLLPLLAVRCKCRGVLF